MKIAVRVAKAHADKPGRYRAWCPTLPGCRVHGRSREEAIDNIDSAIRGYLASLNRPAPRKLKKVVEVPGSRTPCLVSTSANERKSS